MGTRYVDKIGGRSAGIPLPKVKGCFSRSTCTTWYIICLLYFKVELQDECNRYFDSYALIPLIFSPRDHETSSVGVHLKVKIKINGCSLQKPSAPVRWRAFFQLSIHHVTASLFVSQQVGENVSFPSRLPNKRREALLSTAAVEKLRAKKKKEIRPKKLRFPYLTLCRVKSVHQWEKILRNIRAWYHPEQHYVSVSANYEKYEEIHQDNRRAYFCVCSGRMHVQTTESALKRYIPPPLFSQPQQKEARCAG